MKIEFFNTEIAFKSKTSKELKKAYNLFKMVEKPWLVKLGKWGLNIAFALHLPVRGIIKKTIFAQFCGGEDIDECTATIKDLHKNGIGGILDYSLEGKETNADLDDTTAEIIRTIERAKNDVAIPFAVFKPTGISKFSILEKANESIDNLNAEELKDYNLFIDRMHKICTKAKELNVPILIDAEDSWIQESVDRACEEQIFEFNSEKAIVFTTAQLYRVDRLQYIKDLHQRCVAKNVHLGIKLVRGAYMEKERERAADMNYPDPINKTKQDTDRDYDLALEYCIQNIETIETVAGTHNENSSNLLVNLLDKNQLQKNHKNIYFAQLLGMSNHISYNLSANGYNVVKYVPYGPVKEVMPYLMRRAEENTSVAGQTGRELSLIKKEIKRRKKA